MKKNIKRVLVVGNFNVLHPGHLRLFRFAKERAGHLTVAVVSDTQAGSAAYVPENLRLEGVLSNTLVDDAFILSNSIGQLISEMQPDFLVKGKEYENLYNEEVGELKKYGGKLLFSSGEIVYASSDLIRKEFLSKESNITTRPEKYLKRHEISTIRILELIKKFSSLNVCVIGDLIVDEYVACEALGMSQEDPTLVVSPIDSARFIGGAGIVAAHASCMGSDVSFISIIGDDEIGRFAEKELKKAKVKTSLYVDPTRPTTFKKRYRSNGKSLLRVSYLHQTAISSEFQDKVYENALKIMDKVDLLIFSDFNYGCLPQRLVVRLIELAKKHNVFVAADSQSSSQYGDISRYRGMDLITPTEREARISTRNQEDGLVVLAEILKKNSNAKNILLKLGSQGVLIHSSPENIWVTDQIEALNKMALDVAGAGDSLLVASALAIAVGANIWEAAYIGSLAASIQVGRVGNTPIQQNELMERV